MPDNTRTLPSDTPAPSGAADAMDKLFDVQAHTEAAQVLQKQKTDDATALANLHQQFSLQTAQNNSDIAQQNLIRHGTALGALTSRMALAQSQKTGETIPGLTTQGPSNTPATNVGSLTPSTDTTGAIMPGGDLQNRPGLMSALPIDPQVAQQAFQAYGKTADSVLKEHEQDNQASNSDARSRLLDTMGLSNQPQADAATSMYNQLKAKDPDDLRLSALMPIMTPGSMKRETAQSTLDKISEQYQRGELHSKDLQAVGAQRLISGQKMQDSKSRTAIEVAKIRAGGPGGAQAMGNLRKEQAGVSATISSLNSTAARISQQLGQQAYPDKKSEMDAREQLYKIEQDLIGYRQHLDNITTVMSSYNTEASKKPTPGSPQDPAVKRQAFLQSQLKGRDPAKLTAKEKAEINQKYAESGGD